MKQPEFNDTNKIGDILRKFDDRELIRNIREENNGINIYVGSENEFGEDVGLIKQTMKLMEKLEQLPLLVRQEWSMVVF